jgi:hypothetical protein
MSQVHPLLPAVPEHDEPHAHSTTAGDGSLADVLAIASCECALCGASIPGGGLQYRMIPPQSSRAAMTVCHLCRKAALGEGYRPVT